jgi:hypothetical protein
VAIATTQGELMATTHDRTSYHSGVEPATAVVIDPAIGAYPKNTTVQDVLEGINASIEEFGSGSRVFGKRNLNAVIYKRTTKSLYLNAYVSYGTFAHTIRMRARITNATTMSGSFAGDAYVPISVAATVSADAVIKAPVPLTFLAESGPYLRAGGLISGTFTFNAWVAHIVPFTADAVLLRNTEKRQRLRFTCYSRFVRRTEVARGLTLDAVVRVGRGASTFLYLISPQSLEPGFDQSNWNYPFPYDYNSGQYVALSSDVPANGGVQSGVIEGYSDPGGGYYAEWWMGQQYAIWAVPFADIIPSPLSTVTVEFDYRMDWSGGPAEYFNAGVHASYDMQLDVPLAATTAWTHFTGTFQLRDRYYGSEYYSAVWEIYWNRSDYPWEYRKLYFDNISMWVLSNPSALLSFTADALIFMHHEAAEMLPNNGFEYNISPWGSAHPEREGYAELVDWDGSQYDTGRGAMYVETYDVSTDEGAKGSFLARVLKGETYRLVSFVKSLGLPFLFRQKLGRFSPTHLYEPQVFATDLMNYTATDYTQWVADGVPGLTSPCWKMWQWSAGNFHIQPLPPTGSTTLGTPYGPGSALKFNVEDRFGWDTDAVPWGITWDIPGDFLEYNTYRVSFWVNGPYMGRLKFRIKAKDLSWTIDRPGPDWECRTGYDYLGYPGGGGAAGMGTTWIRIDVEFRPTASSDGIYVGIGDDDVAVPFVSYGGELYVYAPEAYEITNWNYWSSWETISTPTYSAWYPVPDALVSTYGEVGTTVRLRYEAQMDNSTPGAEVVMSIRFVRDDGTIIPSLPVPAEWALYNKIQNVFFAYQYPNRVYAWAIDTLSEAGAHTYTVEAYATPLPNYDPYPTPTLSTLYRWLIADNDDLSGYGLPDPSFVADDAVAEQYIDESDWHRVETLWTAGEDYTTVDVGLLSVDIEEDVFLVDRISLDVARLTIPAQADISSGIRMWGSFTADMLVQGWGVFASDSVFAKFVFDEGFNYVSESGPGGSWHIDPFDTPSDSGVPVLDISTNGSEVIVTNGSSLSASASLAGALPYLVQGRLQFDFWVPTSGTDTEYYAYAYPWGIAERALVLSVWQSNGADWALDLGNFDPLFTVAFTPGTWGTAAFLVDSALPDSPALGKLWKRGEAEPGEWSLIGTSYDSGPWLTSLPAPLLDFYWVQAGVTAKVDNLRVWSHYSPVTLGGTLQSDAVILRTVEGVNGTPTVSAVQTLTGTSTDFSFPDIGGTSDDLLLVFVAADYGYESSHWPQWSDVDYIKTSDGDGALTVMSSTNHSVVADQFTVSGSYNKSLAMVRLSASGTGPWRVQVVDEYLSTTYTATPTIGPATPTAAGLSLLAFVGTNYAMTWTPPTGWAEVTEIPTNWASLEVNSNSTPAGVETSVVGNASKTTAGIVSWLNVYRMDYAVKADAVIS